MADEPTDGTQGPSEATDGRTAEVTWDDLGMTPVEAQTAIEQSRKWESRAKSNKAAADELQQIKDAAKTEQQRQAEQLTALQQERDDAVARALVLEVAADHGIDSDMTRFLPVSSDRAEIEEAARLLREKFDAIATETKVPRPPAPDPNQGRANGAGGSTADQFAAAIEQRFRR